MRYIALLMASFLIAVSAQATPPAAVSAPNAVKKGKSTVTNHAAWNLYKHYLNAWNTAAVEQRLNIAADTMTENVEYHTVRHDWSTGRAQVLEDMATFHEKFPGGHFEIGDVSSHHNVALVTWVLIQADGKEFARGHDQLTIARDGKIAQIITFGPSVDKPDEIFGRR